MPDPETTLTYENYLRLPELLTLQTTRSQPPVHDELQFIVVHQVYELWFRLILHEIRATIRHLDAGRARDAIWLLRRLIEIERILQQQVQVLETMSPARFAEFRDLLRPASGLQSVQFRELEFLSGLKDERFLELFNPADESWQRLRTAHEGTTLWSAYCGLLSARGFDVADRAHQMRAVTEIYTDARHIELHQLSEALIEYDEQFRVWRSRHALMAERLIGAKLGTGDAHTGRLLGRPSFQEPGVHYLHGRVALRFFPVLWEVRTQLGSGADAG